MSTRSAVPPQDVQELIRVLQRSDCTDQRWEGTCRERGEVFVCRGCHDHKAADALAALTAERDNWQEAWRLTTEAGNRLAAERDAQVREARMEGFDAGWYRRGDYGLAAPRADVRESARARFLTSRQRPDAKEPS